MGFILGLLAALSFSATSILARIGQRTRPNDDGVFISVFVNVVLLGVAAALTTWPAWDTAAMVSFVIGGVIGTVGGRTSLLRGVRLIGPSRSNAMVTGAPVVAAFAGWLVLGEHIRPVEMLGGALVIGGVLWLISARSSDDPGSRRASLIAYLIAAGAPLSFGLAFVFRKWGLERFDSSLVGAWVGSTSAFVGIMLLEAGRSRLGSRVKENFRSPSWWFVGAGVTSTVALLSQFTAFRYLEAWVVGVLQATQALWTIGLSLIFLRQEERIDASLVGSVALVVSGVVLIAVA